MKIKLSKIKGTQSKRDEGNIGELVRSIKDVGLICPLAVNQNYELLAGRRRFRAISQLGWKEVECNILDSKDKLFDFKVAIEENLKRKNLTDVEVAIAIKEYDELKRKTEGERIAGGKGGVRQTLAHGQGWSQDKTAQDLNISRQAVGTAIQIADAIIEKPELVRLKKGTLILGAIKRLKQHLTKLPENIKIDLKLGDFRELIKEIPDNSIDLILTDPPYSEHFLWLALGKEGKRVLKPSGFLIAYSGQFHLTKILRLLEDNLNYYWEGFLYHKGQTGQQFEVNMWNRAKPILFFYKPPLKKQEKWLEDVLVSEKPEKDLHEWGQSIEPFKKLIDCFTEPNETVLDPMFGGGTVIRACVELKRNVIGFEIKKEYYGIARTNFQKRP